MRRCDTPNVRAGRTIAVLALLSLWLPVMATGQEAPLYKDPAQTVDHRVTDLLSRMTLEEKVAQLTCVWSGKNAFLTDGGDFDPEKAKTEIPHGIGQIGRPWGISVLAFSGSKSPPSVRNAFFPDHTQVS